MTTEVSLSPGSCRSLGLALAWACVLAGPALAAPAAEGNASGRAPVADGVARRALEEALRFADVIYQWEGRAEQGVAYLWGGRMSVDEYLQAVAEGKRPGVEAGVDASGLVVQAYRAADPAIRFVVESGGGEQRVRDTAGLLCWNVRPCPWICCGPAIYPSRTAAGRSPGGHLSGGRSQRPFRVAPPTRAGDPDF